MILREPGQTPYDLNFNLLGFPCRVHPAFFILPVLFSRSFMGADGLNAGMCILIIAAVFFVSILVHELGHTLAFRYFGIESHIVLYMMGGLAIPGGSGGMGSWKAGRTRSLKPNEQIIVSLAGPVAGLLLAVFFIAVRIALGEPISFLWYGPFLFPPHIAQGQLLANSPPLNMLLWSGVVINIVMNLFNLLPVYPLDGGQIARQIFMKVDPWAGVRNSTILSMAVAVFIGLYGVSNGETFLGVFFFYMAYTNYQSMLHDGGNRRPW